jgi:uncharacterized protein (UPF0261 family)
MKVYLLATLDTKGVEAAFLRDELALLGVPAALVDTGCLAQPAVAADVPREQVFAAAGASLDELRALQDRGRAIGAAASGAACLARSLHDAGQLAGVIGLGGSAGTTIATSAMRALPIGVPKLMISTLASGQVRPWVGDKDILMLNAVVDLLGINRISRSILQTAARAMAGMVRFRETLRPAAAGDRPLLAATMFGVTTPCLTAARELLEEAGYEVLVFHATGNGGQAMESLIAEGLIAGVLDITTTELADELVGGILSAGPERLTAAGKRGVPQVISVGALDMVNFGPPETVPAQFKVRKFYRHNPTVTLMRTTVEENRRLGREIGAKASAAAGPVAILLPQRGVSALDREGQPFDDPAARRALFAGINETAAGVPVEEFDLHINDPAFAQAAANRLLEMLRASRPAG